MPATSPSTPPRQRDSTEQLVELVNNLSSKWSLGLELSHERESPQSRRSQTLTTGGECAANCLSKIKYLYFKDRPSLFSALEAFEDTALLQRGLDTQLDAGTLSPKSFDGALSAKQQRKLLDSLYSILDNTFQKVHLQKFPAVNSDYNQGSWEKDLPSTLTMESSSEIKMGNERAALFGRKPRLLITPSNHHQKDPSSTELIPSEGKLSIRNLIAYKEATQLKPCQSTVERRSSIQAEQPFSVLYPKLPLALKLSCNSAERNNTDAMSSTFDEDGIVDRFEAGAKEMNIESIASNLDVVDLLLQDRISQSFSGSFPKLPQSLEKIPFYIRYEITRVYLHADVDIPQRLNLPQVSQMQDYNILWNYLRNLPELTGKKFPERVSSEVWSFISDKTQSRERGVSLMASLSLQNKKGKPGFRLKLEPFSIEQTSRLTRHFGCDRFMKIAIPRLRSEFRGTLNSSDSCWQSSVKEWISSMPHSFLGRTWEWFYVKDAPRRKTTSDTFTGRIEPPKIIHHHYFYATKSSDFQCRTLASKESLADARADMNLSTMLRWLIPLEENQEKQYLKLFSRISLGLTRTRETVKLQQFQILPKCDIRAAKTNAEMNDGCGRLSREMAMSIKDELGLVNLPSAYQGRIGGAKGLWIIDTAKDSMNGVWIEIYSSQEKWRRGRSIEAGEDDPAHRTFEVLNYSRPCKPATLNTQLIPLLESCEAVPGIMRKTISNLLRTEMRFEADELRAAMKTPERLRLWIQSTYSRIRETIHTESVPYLGGFPKCTEEQINLLLDSGFQPNRLYYIWDSVRELIVKRLKVVREKLHIAVPKSTNAFIGVDFDGYLESDEVHLVFSRPMIDEQTGESVSCLDGRDILVARAPAHLPSDIQKVKARFIPELMAIKDVALFSVKGESPLASKLSGGDYDGDRCWICWDEDLVNNFENSPEPAKHDFVREGYVTKDTDTYADLISVDYDPVRTFLRRSFLFNTQWNYLGDCTNYKNAKCRSGFPLKSQQIFRLCALIAELVDGPKQGTVLLSAAWRRMKMGIEIAHKEQAHIYNSTEHILPYLEMEAKDAIDRVLIEFKGIADTCYSYDKDLVAIAREFKETARTSKPAELVMTKLKDDINIIKNKFSQWGAQKNLGKSGNSFQGYVRECSSMWQDIQPAVLDPQPPLFPDPLELNPHYSRWSLLKASLTFYWHYRENKFPWWMCGQQLCFLKAITTGKFNAVSKQMYGILKPNAAVVRLQQDAISEDGLVDGSDADDDYTSDGMYDD